MQLYRLEETVVTVAQATTALVLGVVESGSGKRESHHHSLYIIPHIENIAQQIPEPLLSALKGVR